MATRVALVFDQGSTFETTITLNDANNNPLDVTGMTVAAQMRRDYESINSVSFSTSLSNGALVLSLTAAQTANVESGRYVYDVNLTDSGNNVVRLIEGIATVTPSVTH